MKTSVWQIDDDGAQHQLDLVGSVQLLAAAGASLVAPENGCNAIVVTRVEPVRQTVAAVFVPDQFSGSVSLGGVPLGPGLHGLRHGHRIEVDGRPFWIAIDARPEETQYDPVRHGSDVFCCITTARLNEGDPITICPGVPGKKCGAIYKRHAWQRAVDEPKPFACPDCGFDPREPAWAPPVERPQRTLDELLRIVSKQVEEVSI